ncbi:MAG: hypothetical protein QG662_1701 [Pseudomonadota bacterium]|nr:hypothetical protein [Pseudomonadota bacterium]
MKESTAWLLDFGDELFAAVGERELMHLVSQPHLLTVPLSPQHCGSVLAWQKHLLPVWDIRTWLGQRSESEGDTLAAVVGYQHRPRQTPMFGVIALSSPPRRVIVKDTDACELPDGRSWRTIARSCFLHGQQPVPILDLAAMFTQAPKPSGVRKKTEPQPLVNG